MNSTSINFIHIGYHKIASTFLQLHYFPQINGLLRLNGIFPGHDLDKCFYENFINVNPHTFDRDLFLKSFSEQLVCAGVDTTNYKIRIISDENLSGDINSGLDSRELMKRIYQTFGRVHILIIIRNQLDWLLSAYSNYILHGGIYSIGNWLNSPETRWSMIIEKIKYSYLVEDYINTFGAQEITTLCYEDLWNKNNGIGAYLAKFGLVDNTLPIVKTKSMPGRNLKANFLMAFLNRLGLSHFPKRAKMFSMLPGGTNDRDHIRKVLGNNWEKIIEDNRRLIDITGFKLPPCYFS